MRVGCRGGPHLIPLCTTRFLQFLQQEHAWLHSKISGGSILLNSWSSRPSWGRRRRGQVVWCPPRLPRSPRTPQKNPLWVPRPQTGRTGGGRPRAEHREQELCHHVLDQHVAGHRLISVLVAPLEAQGEDTYLVIPAADAELATQAVGTGTVVHTCAVLGQEAGDQLSPRKRPCPLSNQHSLPPNCCPFSEVVILGYQVVMLPGLT